MACLLALSACSGQNDLQTVYCYRTLADVSCYLEPDQGRESRLIGTYLRDPKAQVHETAASGEERGGVGGLLSASLDIVARILAPIGPVLDLLP
jgi:hypothetical protein